MKKFAILLLFVFGLMSPFCISCGGDDDDDTVVPPSDDDDTDDDDTTGLSVTSVQPSSGPLEGGTMVNIGGSGFESGAKIYFGGNEASNTHVVSDKKITSQTPAASSPGAVTVRIVLANGNAAELPKGFTYTGAGDDDDDDDALISWCILQFPAETTMRINKTSDDIYGRVYAENSTPGAGQGMGIKAELGYGPQGSNPETDAADWNFGSAVYNKDVDGASEGDMSNDEYMGNFSIGELGVFSYTYRFSGDGGATWIYCDLDSNENGLQTEQLGTVTVVEGTDETVDWCKLHYPAETVAVSGSMTELIFGHVYKEGVTDGEGKGPNIVGELGVGPEGTEPTIHPDWQWFPADYNLDTENNDEYMRSLEIADIGAYSFAYRFTVSGSTNYMYCDLDGSDNGFQMEQMGKLTVNEPGGPAPEISSVNPTTGDVAGGAGIAITGANFTDGATVSFGSKDATDVVVASATTITCKTPGNPAGPTAVTVRNPDGQTATLENGFTYIEPNPMVAWCNLQFPETLSSGVSEETAAIYGQVFHPGVTEAAGAGPGIMGYIGYTVKSGASSPEINPGDWMWLAAAFNVEAENNDEYAATLTLAGEGEYYYAYKFSIDGGETWRYCDLDGSDNGFDLAQSGVLTVSSTPPAPPVIDSILPVSGDITGGDEVIITGENFDAAAVVYFGSEEITPVTFTSATELKITTPAKSTGKVDVTVKNPDGGSVTASQGFEYIDMHPVVDVAWLQYPSEITIAAGSETESIFGRVYEPGVTELMGKQDSIMAQLGFGPSESDPDGNGDWAWTDAAFNTDYENDDEYMATFTVPAVAAEGNYDYAYRFSLDSGATWYYADTDPATADYDSAKAGKLTVVTTPTDPAPVVSSVVPDSGDIAGGETVTVGGENFVDGASVTFDGLAATEVSVDSATAITCKTPPHTAGKVVVTVKNPDNQSGSLNEGFAFTETDNLPDWYNLQYPSVTSVKPGESTETIFGQIYEADVTNDDASNPGAGITAELGYGLKGADPTDSGSGWVWKAAAYNADIGNNDEFGASITISDPGQYSYTMRYALNGSEWVYGDLTGSDDGFSIENLGLVTVSNPTPDWCNLEGPSTIEVDAGVETAEIFGQIYETGVTDGYSQGPGVKAQAGYGPDATSPESGTWAWVDAEYSGKSGTENHNDRYSAKFTVSDAGSYDFAYRFSLDDGNNWTYADLDGSTNGYDVAQAGSMTVNAVTTISITDILPAEGILSGGTIVKITGEGFASGVVVKFGETGAADVVIVSDTEITATTAATTAAGVVEVSVSLTGESDALPDAFTYTATTNDNITWCILQHPAATTTSASTATEDIFGRAFKSGVTEPEGQGSGIIAQVGFGPNGQNPTQNDNGWSWYNAVYNVDDGNNDEYKQTLTPETAGSYSYAYRFSDDDGVSFSYCDLDDLSTGGFTADQMGALTVE